MYLLDTNACIDFLLGRSDRLAGRIADALGQIAIATITVAELKVGARTSSDAPGDKKRVDMFVAGLIVEPFDLDAAEAYAKVVREVGVRRSSFDRLIGAQAIRLNATLVTRNRKDFADLPGLLIEDWTR